MTTMAIIAGMLPVAVGRGDGSASRAAVAVVGGQALCLLVTLVITPVVYSLFDDLRGLPRRLLGWRPAWRPRAVLGQQTGPSAQRAAPVRRLLALGAGLGLAGGALAQVAPPPAPPAPPAAPAAPPATAPQPAPAARPGRPAPPEVVGDLRSTLARAIERFEARDLDGVLAHVSGQYHTGPFTRATVRAQLAAMFSVYEAMRARVRIDEVRLVGDHAWVWSTGEASGRLPFVGQWIPLLWWERELEIARRENGVWRLFGYQQ